MACMGKRGGAYSVLVWKPEGKSSLRILRHKWEDNIRMVATFGKILGNFSPIVPPSAAGVRLRRFRRWGLPVARVGTF